ncbi:MAG: hypothetical protein IPJ94_22805 [Chloroflexi bacterium]|nr:hypothetical protein [Chloroflexota bacterium]
MNDIYQWLAEGRLKTMRAPGKCLVIESLAETLPEELLAQILEDVAEKRGHRTSLFHQFVSLLENYSGSIEFHQQIGEYLGIDRFSSGRIHQTLSGDLVRSKSEVIIANILFQSGIPFQYELSLRAPDGTHRLPDFTIEWQGNTYFWEHLGMLDIREYEQEWQVKKSWYERYFPHQLITTEETTALSQSVRHLISTRFGIEQATEENE